MIAEVHYIAALFFVNFILSVVSYPLSGLLFPKFSDRGYAFSALLGWVSVSYIHFLLSTLGILKISLSGSLLSLMIWGGINALIQWKLKPIQISRSILLKVSTANILFLALVIFWTWVRGHNPEIYQIERFMDFGFIQSLMNTESLPLYDMWYSGEILNYYYFGHMIGFEVLTLSNIPMVPGFFVLVVWMFGTVGVGVYRLASEYYLYIFGVKYGKWTSILAGIVGLFLGLFSGTIHSAIWLWSYVNNWLTEAPLESFWYAEPTRFIEGTITEMPIYSFIVADLHAHVWGMFFGIIIFALFLGLWQKKHHRFSLLNIHIIAITISIGLAYITNAWDALTLGAVSMMLLVLLYCMYDLSKFDWRFLTILAIPFGSLAISLPWSYFFEAPLGGIGVVDPASKVYEWSMYWGGFAIILLISGIVFLFQQRLRALKHIKEHSLWYLFGFGGVSAFWLLGYALKSFAIKQGNEGLIGTFLMLIVWAAVIVLAVIWLSDLLFKKVSKRVQLIAGISAGIAIFWILMEHIYFKDILTDGEWFRANTVFKISTQVWIWLSIIIPSLIIYLVTSIKHWGGKLLITLLVVGLLGVHAIYPFKAIAQANTANREFIGFDRGLDWWKNKLPYDYEAYQFLKEYRDALPEDDKVRYIVEADGDSYQDNNMFSIFLGWPSIIGWPVHEWTWHGSYDDVDSKRKDVVELYIGTDIDMSRKLLREYQIDFIILGQVEKRLYEDRGLQTEKLESLGTVIFENAETKIIQIQK
ncbi:hypothetical protein KC717_01460 [Candidatus Dojkabacteria bacterium]|uniref:YYY membrane protein n=1 Tax=Candidatus Dojkabacteria bacterium TaxID=2099670 RepID=A0A955L7A9_9BACT|nr:hypothetical protein [Candidatus Dojkabacteria bacterium]